jgi:hypothetical protein
LFEYGLIAPNATTWTKSKQNKKEEKRKTEEKRQNTRSAMPLDMPYDQQVYTLHLHHWRASTPLTWAD